MGIEMLDVQANEVTGNSDKYIGQDITGKKFYYEQRDGYCYFKYLGDSTHYPVSKTTAYTQAVRS